MLDFVSFPMTMNKRPVNPAGENPKRDGAWEYCQRRSSLVGRFFVSQILKPACLLW
jgi:hypothetical protein